MAELILERSQRLELRAQAHHLAVTVQLGAQGFTEAVLKEIDRALRDHGLIKVHVPSDDREERTEIYHTTAEKLGAARIQEIGKMLVFYRPPEEAEETAEKERDAVRTQQIRFGAKLDKGASGMRRPAAPAEKGAPVPESPRAKKVAVKKPGMKKAPAKKVVIKARPKHKRLTKKAALS